jgi:hypothetical protein
MCTPGRWYFASPAIPVGLSLPALLSATIALVAINLIGRQNQTFFVPWKLHAVTISAFSRIRS